MTGRRTRVSPLSRLVMFPSSVKTSSLSDEPANSTGLGDYHAHEGSVHGCMMSPWCTSLAVLTHILAYFPLVHSGVQLTAPWLHAQQRKFCVLMPRLAFPTLRGNVTHWHANGFSRVKRTNRVSCWLGVALTWRAESPDRP